MNVSERAAVTVPAVSFADDASEDIADLHVDVQGDHTKDSDFSVNFPDPALKSRSVSLQVPSTSRNTMDLTSTALVADRLNLSDRAVSAIASSLLNDLGVVSKEDASLVIDRSKIRRERDKLRRTLQTVGEAEARSVEGVYFDGRKDETLVEQMVGHKKSTRTVTEYHISVIKEPGAVYLTHLCPSGGTASEITTSILHYFTNIG